MVITTLFTQLLAFFDAISKLLWPVRGQKEDTEAEKVGRKSVLNKQKRYTKIRVLAQLEEVSIRNCYGLWVIE